MKLSRLLIGGHTELTRPVYSADERLMRRINEARRRLGDVQVKPVRTTGKSVWERDRAAVPARAHSANPLG